MSQSNMRAWTHSKAGHPSKILSLTSNLPVPTVKAPNDVLVRVSYTALHPGSSVLMQLCPFIFRSTPAIPETEFSGTIVTSGADVSSARSLMPGTAVFGSVPVGLHLRGGVGALAEFLVVDADCVARMPDGVELELAAGLPVSGCTALALMEKAGLKSGDSVLVNGASGGIGHMVVQLAKRAVGESGRVVAVCSERNFGFVTGLGADEAIDYQKHAPVWQYLAKHYSNSRFDVVIDAYGIQELYTHSSSFLAEKKPFVTVGITAQNLTIRCMIHTVFLMLKNMLLPWSLGGGSRPYSQVAAFASLQGLETLTELVQQGYLKVVTDSCWDMKDLMRAYEIVLAHRARGKVVVKVQE